MLLRTGQASHPASHGDEIRHRVPDDVEGCAGRNVLHCLAVGVLGVVKIRPQRFVKA
jgi:hypothetical protein